MHAAIDEEGRRCPERSLRSKSYRGSKYDLGYIPQLRTFGRSESRESMKDDLDLLAADC